MHSPGFSAIVTWAKAKIYCLSDTLFYTALRPEMLGIAKWRKKCLTNRLTINTYRLASLKLLVEIHTTKDRASGDLNFARDSD